MQATAVTQVEDRLIKILTPLAGLLTAAGGLAGLTGVITPLIRGEERTAFLSFVLLVAGFVTLIYVRLYKWAPENVNGRLAGIFLAVGFFAISFILAAYVYVLSIGRDQRPTIALSVVSGERIKLTGAVASGGMAFDERLAVNIRVGPDQSTGTVVMSQVSGPGNDGTGSIAINSDLDIPANSVIVVEAWLPDRSAEPPNCSILEAEAAESPDAAGPATAAPSPSQPPVTAAPARTATVVERVVAWIPKKQPFVSCLYINPPPFITAGPRVTVASSEGRTVTVNVASPALQGEGVLLRVWNRSRGDKMLYSNLIFPGDTGQISGTATIQLGRRAANICAVAVQGSPGELASTALDPAQCSIGAAPHQGWAELLVKREPPTR